MVIKNFMPLTINGVELIGYCDLETNVITVMANLFKAKEPITNRVLWCLARAYIANGYGHDAKDVLKHWALHLTCDGLTDEFCEPGVITFETDPGDIEIAKKLFEQNAEIV